MTRTALSEFLDSLEVPQRSLVVANRQAPQQLQRMLEGMFADQPVTIREESLPETAADTVLLVEDGEVIATSPLEALQEAILLVNSDLYVTGTRSHQDLDLPAVLRDLDETRFHLRGYPESNNEKLLLITISRYIERLASEAGEDSETSTSGTMRASFQQLSRINDERGTRAVYEQLAETPVDTHVYGQPDWVPPRELNVTMHGGYTEDFRNAWFVVYRPAEREGTGQAAGPTDPTGTPAALLAVEREPRKWDGFWTFDPDFVADIDEYIRREL